MVDERAYLRRSVKKLRPKRSKIDRSSSSGPTTAALSTSSMTPIRFSVNVVIPPGVAGPIGRFLQAGHDSPFYDVSEVPESLRAFIASGEESDPEPDDSPQSLNYTVNTVYDLDERGFRRSRVGRELGNRLRKRRSCEVAEMADHGVGAQVQLAAWCDRVFGLEVESFGRSGSARKDTCKLEMTGQFLFYDVTLDGGWVFLSLQVMDKGDPPESIVHFPDNEEGWHALAQLISAFERHNVKSLERPIEIGKPGGPGGWVIA